MIEEKFTDKFQDGKLASNQEIKSYGIGIRHLQIFCMTLTMVCLIIARASMGIAVLAMSDDSPNNNTLINNTHNISASRMSSNDSNLDEIYGSNYNGTDVNINDVIIVTTEKYTDTDVNNNNTVGDEIFETNTTFANTNDGIEKFKWDKNTQSMILSSFFWGYVWMQVPSGFLTKKFGGKLILLSALVSNGLICCFVPLFAGVGGWKLVCACRAAMGLTQACLFTSTQTLIGQWLPDSERTSYVGVVFAGMQLGTVIAMPLSGVLADTSMGWKLIFYAVAGLLFFNSAVWYWFTADSPREHRMISQEEKEYIEAGLNVPKTRPPTPWKHILRSKPVWALVAPHTGFYMNFLLFFVDMPTYLEKALHIRLKDSALLSALPYMGMWFGSIFSSFLSERIYNKKLMSVTLSRKVFQSISQFGIASGLIVLSFLGPENKAFAVVTLIIILTTSGFATAGFLVNQLDLSPNFAGVIMSIENFIANFANALLPMMTSYILQNDSSNLPRWHWVFRLIAGVSVITNTIYLVFGTAERQEWDDPNFSERERADSEEMQPVLPDHKEKYENNKKEENGVNKG